MAADTQYDGEHSITFVNDEEERNTWESWHLIPTSRPSVAASGVSTNFVEIPGRGAAIDMSEYLTGAPVYSSRNGSWEFIVDNEHEYWESIRISLMNFLHGKRMRVILEDVPTRYYTGRFSVSDWKSDSANSSITINYVLDPFSYPVVDPNGDWLWDPFNFETDYTDGRERTASL